MTRFVVGLLALLLVGGLVAAACGGGDDDGDGDRGDSGAEDAGEDGEVEGGPFDGARLSINGADQELAQKIVVTLADLPAEWFEDLDDGEEAGGPESPEISEFIDLDLSGLTVTGEGEGGDFVGDVLGTIRVSSDSALFESEEQARTAFEQLNQETTLQGYAEGLESIELEGGDFTAVTFERAEAPGVGEQSAAARFTLAGSVEVGGESQAFEVLVELVLIQRGRAGASLVLFSFGVPFDLATGGLGGELAAAMAARMGGGASSASAGEDADSGESGDAGRVEEQSSLSACPEPPHVVELRAQNVQAGLDGFDEPAFTIVDAVGVDIANGAAYTLYLADYAIDRDEVGSTTLHPPAGNVLITLFITQFFGDTDPVAVSTGDTVTVSDEGQTFGLIIERGEENYNTSPGSSGTIEILHVDDDLLCVQIDYQDLQDSTMVDGELVDDTVQNRLSGAVSVELVDF